MFKRCKVSLLFITWCLITASHAQAVPVDTLKFGAFGKIAIYKPAGDPKAVILFVSGDGGWNSGVVDMARDFVAQGAMVAGIDILTYYRGLKTLSADCYYPAADFEELSMMLQKKYKIARYLKPILVGYSSGATLVYGTLVQAPAGTFKGAISLGFCPDIEINKPLCGGSGLKQHPLKEGHSYYLEASGNLTAPFIALHGLQDQVCPFPATKLYMKEVNTGQLIELPKVGHGFSVASSWLPQFVEAYNRVLVYPPYTGQKPIRDTLPQSLKHLPLNEDFPIVPIPATVKDSLPIAFLISGDGGWTGFDYSIGKSLADKGIPVIGLDAQKYFWKLKTPEETATEVSRALTYYMQEWKKTKFILAGYSYGACIIPFIATRLPGDLQGSLIGIYGLSPDITVDFEVHITDMIGFGRAADSFKVADEIKKIRQFQPVCIFGESESADLRTRFSEAGAKIITIPGNHHYNARPSAPADAIFREVEAIRNK